MCNLPGSRVTRRVFDWDRQHANVKGTWCYAARQVLNELHQPDLFDEVSPCDPTSAQNSIKNIDDNEWDINRYKSEKLRYYNLYKPDKSPEEYLMLDISKYQRSVFSQFRCGILPLEIEVGRYRDV